MRNKSHNAPLRPACRGFTLLEVLTAMFILTIVVTLVFGSFDSVFTGADHVNLSSDLFEMGHACLNRISADLQAIHVATYPRYKPPDMDDEPEIYRFVASVESVGGEAFTQLRFTSLAHLAFNQETREGIAEIVYYVQPTDNGGYILRRADKLYPYPEFEENDFDPVLCEQVRKFELVYYDAEGHEYDQWDSEDDDFEYSTPRSVGVKLALGDEENPYIFTTEITLPMQRPKTEKRS